DLRNSGIATEKCSMLCRLLIVPSVAAAIIATCGIASGQEYTYTSAYPSGPPVATVPVPAATSYSADQLDQMLGPIALYPDPLLSQILAASTYPQDVAAAAQWLAGMPSPTDAEISAQPWDPSVQALVRFPSVLNMMAGNMEWTTALGNAFASQQA